MKKMVIVLMALSIQLSLLTGCMWDPYARKRPYDYNDAKWSSEDPEIWFIVDRTQEDYYYPRGKVLFDGDERWCVFYFIHQTNRVSVFIVDDPNDYLPDPEIAGLWGTCAFSEDKLVVTIDQDQEDTLFFGRYETLTFYRETSTDA